MHFRPAQPDDTPTLKALTAGTGVFKPHEVEVLQEVLDGYHARDADSQHVAVVAEDHADAHLKRQVMGPGGRRGGHQGEARLRALGAGLLRRL